MFELNFFFTCSKFGVINRLRSCQCHILWISWSRRNVAQCSIFLIMCKKYFSRMKECVFKEQAQKYLSADSFIYWLLFIRIQSTLYDACCRQKKWYRRVDDTHRVLTTVCQVKVCTAKTQFCLATKTYSNKNVGVLLLKQLFNG